MVTAKERKTVTTRCVALLWERKVNMQFIISWSPAIIQSETWNNYTTHDIIWSTTQKCISHYTGYAVSQRCALHLLKVPTTYRIILINIWIVCTQPYVERVPPNDMNSICTSHDCHVPFSGFHSSIPKKNVQTPENGEIALLLATNRWYAAKCVTRKRNSSNDKSW